MRNLEKIRQVKAHLFFIFDQLWASLGIREIGEKLTNLAKMSHKSALFHSALRASRTSFGVEAFFEGISHTFKAPKIGGYHKTRQRIRRTEKSS